MCNIETFVFIDIETTGLPWQERNKTKITEICLVSVSRKDLLVTRCGGTPTVSKLSLFFNPQKTIHPEATRLTGLSNDLLRYAPTFKEKIGTISSFLQELPKPVCLVAHNGNKFDYRIILAEFDDANVSPPQYLLCVDSLVGFKEIFKSPLTSNKYINKVYHNSETENNIMTDDEDVSDNEDWPDLNVSAEDWEDIDEFIGQRSVVSCHNSVDPLKISKQRKFDKKKTHCSAIYKTDGKISKVSSNSFTLSALYKRIFDKEAIDAHRAENDCMMLLECVTATKMEFIPWADRVCVKLTDIQPIVRK